MARTKPVVVCGIQRQKQPDDDGHQRPVPARQVEGRGVRSALAEDAALVFVAVHLAHEQACMLKRQARDVSGRPVCGRTERPVECVCARLTLA